MELIHVSGNTDCLLGKTAIGVYRIDDTRCILFDNGYSKEYDELVGSLKDAGLTPAGLIVSHAHIDHHGNSKRLREAFQIPLAMSLGEAGLIASQAALERYTNYFGRSEEEKVSIDTEQRCPVDCIIQPEDTSVTLCGVTFPVHHLPGHSPRPHRHRHTGRRLLCRRRAFNRKCPASRQASILRPRRSGSGKQGSNHKTALPALDFIAQRSI